MKQTNNKQLCFPIPELRETLRLRAYRQASQLTRSVSRLTSFDALPCLEYDSEITTEHRLAESMFYYQQCRRALEHCIAKGSSTLRFRLASGEVVVTRFKKTGPNRVAVRNLSGFSDQSAAS